MEADRLLSLHIEQATEFIMQALPYRYDDLRSMDVAMFLRVLERARTKVENENERLNKLNHD